MHEQIKQGVKRILIVSSGEVASYLAVKFAMRRSIRT
jgi:hypothetical protein